MNIDSKYKNEHILFETNSVINWGYTRQVPLEYDYYSEQICKDINGLTEESYQLLMNGPNKITDYQNSINFVIDVDMGHNLDKYTEMYKLSSATTLFCSLRHLTEKAFLGGIIVPVENIDRFIFGFEEPLLSFLQEGDFTKGSDPSTQTFVSINDIYYNTTLVNDTNVEVYTGNRHKDKVKKTRSVNGGVYLNNVVAFFDGYNVTHGNINPMQDNFKVEGTDGYQFKPDISQNSHVTVFDTKKIYDVKYKYTGKKEYSQIKTYKFEFDPKTTQKSIAQNSKLNINYNGFFNVSSNFKLPIGVSSSFFVNCDESDYGSVMVDGADVKSKQNGIKNMMTIQPESGFMIETFRDEMVSLNLHEKILAFPSLDGISGFIPLMRVSTSTQVDQETFNDKFGFVNNYNDIKYYFRVIFFPLAGVSLLLALLFIWLYKKAPKPQGNQYAPHYAQMRDMDEPFMNQHDKLVKKTENQPLIKNDYNSYEGPIGGSTKMEVENSGDSSP